MRKLIAVLERDAERAGRMASWLDDRLAMYDRFLEPDPEAVVGAIGPRLGDVLVLCLGRESLGGPNGEALLTDFLLAQPVRFPILVHSEEGPGPGERIDRLGRKGWTLKTIGPIRGDDWFGTRWYPALKTALYDLAGAGPAPILPGTGGVVG